MPWFVELQNRYGSERLQVLGVAMDDANSNDIGKFAKDLGVNYPILVGKDAVGNAYGGVQFLPSTFYIARDGKIDLVRQGFDWRVGDTLKMPSGRVLSANLIFVDDCIRHRRLVLRK